MKINNREIVYDETEWIWAVFYQEKVTERLEQNSARYVRRCRLCFREIEGSNQCQRSRSTCTGWSTSPSWSSPFRDDTDDRGGGCTYQWRLECAWKTKDAAAMDKDKLFSNDNFLPAELTILRIFRRALAAKRSHAGGNCIKQISAWYLQHPSK